VTSSATTTSSWTTTDTDCSTTEFLEHTATGTSDSPSTNDDVSIPELVEHTPTITRNLPATNAVLSLTELLEHILSCLDIQALFRLRRVSHYWNRTIAGNLVLQRIMFLAPEPEGRFQWHLKRSAPGKAHRYFKRRRGTEPEPADTILRSSRPNPLVFGGGHLFAHHKVLDGTKSVDLCPRARFNDKFMDGETSELFGRMLVAQPPVTRALMGGNIHLHNDNGIKVIDLIDAMHQFEPWRRCSAWAYGYGGAFFVADETMFPTEYDERKVGFGVGLVSRCTGKADDGTRVHVSLINMSGRRRWHDWLARLISELGGLEV
jgi:hypothetical protein